MQGTKKAKSVGFGGPAHRFKHTQSGDPPFFNSILNSGLGFRQQVQELRVCGYWSSNTDLKSLRHATNVNTVFGIRVAVQGLVRV